MLIASSVFCLSLLCCADSKGNPKLPYGRKKSLDNKTKKLLENMYNWRTKKNKPRDSTIEAMRDGEFGDAVTFVPSFMNARNSEMLADWLDNVYDGFNDGLDVVHAVDRKIGEYLNSGNDEVLMTMKFPRILKECVKSFRTTRVLSCETVCLFYFYFWICIESRFDPHKPFQMVFAGGKGKTLYDSFIKNIRSGIRKRKHKMAEVHKRLGMDYKEFDNRLRTPSRFCNPDFLKNFADAYYELCFLNESRKPQDSDAMFRIWNAVAHAVWIMDKAKEAWNLDFRIFAHDYFVEFSSAVPS